MRRLVLIAIYDFQNIVDSYLEYLLERTNEIATRLIIIVNDLDRKNESILSRYGECVFRKNEGYDGGAFKEQIIKLYREGELEQYDELILMNDSFYGPFVSWDNIFDDMESRQLDYWGLTESIEKIKDSPRPDFEAIRHVQGYFMVLKKDIFTKKEFIDFWENMPCSKNYSEAVQYYELDFNYWLLEQGYRGGSYLSYHGGKKYILPNTNIYLEYPYELIAECECPILKRKAINILSWPKIEKILKYLSTNTDYDTNMIIDNWERYDHASKSSEIISIEEIKQFCLNKEHVYVYGKGFLGKQLMAGLNTLGIDADYVVTKLDYAEEKTHQIDKISFSESDGIIVGVGRELRKELLANALKYVSENQVICLSRD